MHVRVLVRYLPVLMLCGMTSLSACGGEPVAKLIRAGIIGLDTSHVIAFTQCINDPKAAGDLAGVRIVAAFPGGSPDIPDSWNRVKEYTERCAKWGFGSCRRSTICWRQSTPCSWKVSTGVRIWRKPGRLSPPGNRSMSTNRWPVRWPM